MKCRKIILTALVLSAAFNLCAVPVSEYLALGISGSPTAVKYAESRRDSLLALTAADAKVTPAWSVDFGTFTYMPEAPALGSVYSWTPGASFSITPNGGDTTYTSSLTSSFKGVRQLDESIDDSVSVTLGGGLSKSINLGYSSETDNSFSEEQIEYSYRSKILNLEISMLTDIKTIATQEINIENTRRSLDSYVATAEKAVILGTMTEGSTRYTELSNTLASQKRAIEATENTIALLKDNFYKKYGVPYEFPEIECPDVPMPEVLEEGNFGVKTAEHALENASAALDAVVLPVKTLVLNANASSTAELTDLSKISASAVASATYGDSLGWSAGASATLRWDSTSDKFTPVFTISGKYSSPTQTALLEIKQEQAGNTLAEAEVALSDAKDEYVTAISSLCDSVADFYGDVTEAEMDVDYANLVLENTLLKLELGLATQKEAEDAAFSLKKAENSLLMTYIDGMILLRKIELAQM